MGNGNKAVKNPLIDQWMKAIEQVNGKPALRFGTNTGSVLITADNETALADFCYLFPMPSETTIN